jgi:5-methylcytosine-specific restriction endonuclease McrA
VFIKYEARCAKCREKVALGNYQIDHIQRLDALGKHELDNWQLLCVPCHKPKTKVDNAEAKKGARIRGERGSQRARRERRGESSIKAPAVSALSKTARGYVKKAWPKRGWK